MRICAVNKNISSNYISFKAGNTSIYSGFDGVYMPFSHNDVCNNGELSDNQDKKAQFNSMYSKFAEFFKARHDQLKFTITTGRNKAEYNYFVDKIHKQDLDFVAPDSLITRDGCNKFDIDENGEYIKDENRIEDVKAQTNGWDRVKIEKDLKNILNNQHNKILMLDSPINKHKYDYEEFSLEHKLNKIDNAYKKNWISFSKDEDLNIEIALSKELDINQIKKSFKDYFDKRNLKVQIKTYTPDYSVSLPAYNGSHYQLEPANILHIKPIIGDEVLSKLYDVKNEVKKNIENKTDDLVIVTGDGSDDEKMLNPLNYLDIYDLDINKNQNQDELLEDPQFLNALKDLPLVSIVIGNGKSLKYLRQLGEKLDEKGIHKIITVENPQSELLNKIKEGMLNYGKQNYEYKSSLWSDLYIELLKRDE